MIRSGFINFAATDATSRTGFQTGNLVSALILPVANEMHFDTPGRRPALRRKPN